MATRREINGATANHVGEATGRGQQRREHDRVGGDDPGQPGHSGGRIGARERRFFCNADHEFANKAGPVHDAIAAQKQRWTAALVAHIEQAQALGQIRSEVDPDQLAFELDAAGILANSRWQLYRDEHAISRARTMIRAALNAAATESGQAAPAAEVDVGQSRRRPLSKG